MRESHQLGFGSHCERHAELLNRTVSERTAKGRGHDPSHKESDSQIN